MGLVAIRKIIKRLTRRCTRFCGEEFGRDLVSTYSLITYTVLVLLVEPGSLSLLHLSIGML
jgi:hypothetical protein